MPGLDEKYFQKYDELQLKATEELCLFFIQAFFCIALKKLLPISKLLSREK